MSNIDIMFNEVLSTMRNNFKGNPKERFEHAKALYLHDVADAIEQNKEMLIQEFTAQEY
jgi:hypothetical protein